MKIKLPPEKIRGNIKIVENLPEERKRLQEILNDPEGNAIRTYITNYYANIIDPVGGRLNINYRNGNISNPNVSIPDEIQI